MTTSCVSWLHFGDLHARAEDDWLGVRRLREMLAEFDGRLDPGEVDFVFLPGDNANEGEPAQYGKISEAFRDVPPPGPLRIIPGDHDFVPGDLKAFDDFRNGLDAPSLPAREDIKGRRALFLDVVSAGGGGPQFDVGRKTALWLKHQLDEARREDALPPVVFMHTFPADLAYGGEEIAQMLADAGVALVDTGHTHYNEVINDGSVIYTSGRSTAQIEEGGEDAFGAVFVAVDGDQASFRFRRAGSGWPFVQITSPADHRLQVRGLPLDDDGRLRVRAKVLGARGDAEVTLTLLGETLAMTPVAGETALWSATFEPPWRRTVSSLSPPERRIEVTVRAQTADGVGEDTIRLGSKIPAPPVGRAGAAGGSIGAWPEHGLLGTRLGPNAYGKDW